MSNVFFSALQIVGLQIEPIALNVRWNVLRLLCCSCLCPNKQFEHDSATRPLVNDVYATSPNWYETAPNLCKWAHISVSVRLSNILWFRRRLINWMRADFTPARTISNTWHQTLVHTLVQNFLAIGNFCHTLASNHRQKMRANRSIDES